MSVRNIRHFRRQDADELFGETASRIFRVAFHEDHDGFFVDDGFETIVEGQRLLLFFGRFRKLVQEFSFFDQLFDDVEAAQQRSVDVQLEEYLKGKLVTRGVFDGASGAAVAALFVGAQTPSGHK